MTAMAITAGVPQQQPMYYIMLDPTPGVAQPCVQGEEGMGPTPSESVQQAKRKRNIVNKKKEKPCTKPVEIPATSSSQQMQLQQMQQIQQLPIETPVTASSQQMQLVQIQQVQQLPLQPPQQVVAAPAAQFTGKKGLKLMNKALPKSGAVKLTVDETVPRGITSGKQKEKMPASVGENLNMESARATQSEHSSKASAAVGGLSITDLDQPLEDADSASFKSDSNSPTGKAQASHDNKDDDEKTLSPVEEMPTHVPELSAPPHVLVLKPQDGIFNRMHLLRIGKVYRQEKIHPAVSDFRTMKVCPTGKSPQLKPPKKIKDNTLRATDKGYKIQLATKREDELERNVRSLLNKITPQNLTTIVEHLARVELHTANELESVIRVIFGKALLEPFYCETYADMVIALRTRYPEFPAENEGEKPYTFLRMLLNVVQHEFESLPTSFEPTDEERAKYSAEDLELEMKKRKDKMLANMKFIGNLFFRQLIAVKVIGQVVHDLIGIKDNLPEEHMIECVCELLRAIGHTLDGTKNGEILVSQFASRLLELKGLLDPKTGKGVFSKRIQFAILNLLDLRGNKWQKRKA